MADHDDPYEELYCPSLQCRVNTFERGSTGKHSSGPTGLCPGCETPGRPVR